MLPQPAARSPQPAARSPQPAARSPQPNPLVASLVLALFLSFAASAAAEKPFLTYYGDPVTYRNNPQFGASAAYGAFQDGDEPALVVGAPLADPIDGDVVYSNDGEVFALYGPFADGLPHEVTALSIERREYRFLGRSVAYLPGFWWINGSPSPGFAVGAPGSGPPISSGLVYQYHYDDQSIVEESLSPASLVSSENTGHVVVACDFNGDSYSDVAVGCNQTSGEGDGMVTIYLGGDGSDSIPDITIVPGYLSNGFGWDVADVGDLNGDGIRDLGICDGDKGRAYVVFGRVTGQAETPLEITVSDDGNTYTGITIGANGCFSVAGGVDLTGNGYEDLVVGSKDSGSSLQWLTVYRGPFALGTMPQVASEIRGGGTFGNELAVGGDINGDGQPDLLVGCPSSSPRGEGYNRGMIAVFMGGTLPVELFLDEYITTPDRWFVSPTELNDHAFFGKAVGYMGDHDADDKDDVYVGAPGMNHPSGDQSGKIYGISLASSDRITVTNLTPTILAYNDGGSVGFSVAADHVDELQLKVTMSASELGVENVELTDNGDGTYSHLASGMSVGPGEYDVEFFAVSSWESAVGGDGSFTLVESTVHAVDNSVMYVAPADPADATGLTYSGIPYSSVAWDFNDDGDKDLFISISDYESKLCRGDDISQGGIPHFVEWPNLDFDNGAPQPALRGLAVGDMDHTDGRTDLFAAHAAESRLYRWNGTHVVNVAPETGVDIFTDAVSGTWGDLNGDGHLDLFLARAEAYTEDPPNYGAPKSTPASLVLTNIDDGAGGRMFTTTPSAALPQNLYSTNATWGDFDQDGDPDLFVGAVWSAGAGASKLYRNDDGVFSDQTTSLLGIDPVVSVVASAWHDMNNDSRLDLVLTRHGAPALIYFGTVAGGFDNGAGGAGPLSLGPTHGYSSMCVYDYNNDGWLDYLGLSNDDTRTVQIFLNVAGAESPTFAECSDEVGFTDTGYAHGAVAADFGGIGGNLDGVIDLFLGRSTASDAFYFKAEPFTLGIPVNHFVGVRLIGAPGVVNGPGIGTTVELQAPHHVQIQQVDGGSMRGGQSPSELVFGLGLSSRPVTATITWPNGEVYADVPLQVDEFNEISYNVVTIIESTVESSYDLLVGGHVEWVFTWETLSSDLPTINAVHFDLEGVVYQCSPELGTITGATSLDVTSTCTLVGSGRYATEIRWTNRDCVPKCHIPFRVETGTTVQSDLSDEHELTVSICAGF